MANYNTFVVVNTKTRKPVLVTSSARKAAKLLMPGIRIEVWSDNMLTETIYTRTKAKLDPYITAERDYIRVKQEAATRRNQKRRPQKYEA